jgi:methionyl-tRNA formyltransferase
VSRPRAVFAGSGAFGRRTLEGLADASRRSDGPVELAAVLTAPAREAGRGRRIVETPIAEAARRLGVSSVLTPARLRSAEAIAEVRSFEPDLLVVADYGQLVPPALLDLPAGALNLHPSRLPRHRGAAPIPATILAGDPDTAVTLIRMDAGLDTGPIVAVSEPVAVAPDATTPALEATLEVVAAALLRSALEDWLGGEITPVPQPHEGATMTRPLTREDGRLDPLRPAFLLERAVRAYRPWPGSFLETDRGDRLGVLRAAVDESGPGDHPGRLVPDRDGIALATSDGRLRLLELQPAGGRPMPAEALLRGRHGLLGASVVGGGATMADR